MAVTLATAAGLTALQTRINRLPEFYPEDYGAVGDGVANDTVPVQNAFNAAYADGGGTVVLSRRYGWKGDLFHRGGVVVRGVSALRQLIINDGKDRGLVALDGTARYRYGSWADRDDPTHFNSTDDNPGGLYDLVIDGVSVGGAANGLFIWQGVDGFIQNCRIVNPAKHAVIVDGAQNSVMSGGLVGLAPNGTAMLFDTIEATQGAGNIKVRDLYLATSKKLMHITGKGNQFWPHDIWLSDCLLETYDDGTDIVHQEAGEVNYHRCLFTNSTDSTLKPPNQCLVLITQDIYPSVGTRATFDSCYFNGGVKGVPQLIKVRHTTNGTGNLVRFYGRTELANGGASGTGAFVGLSGGAQFSSMVDVSGPVDWITTFTNYYKASDGAWLHRVAQTTQTPTIYAMPDNPTIAAGAVGLFDPTVFKRASDEAYRASIDRDGTLRWLSGEEYGRILGSLAIALGPRVDTNGDGVADPPTTGTMNMGGRWRLANQWSIGSITRYIAGTAVAAPVIVSPTAAPSTRLVFLANNTSAAITVTGGADEDQVQVALFAPGATGCSVTWPSNVVFNGTPPQPPPAGGVVVVNLVNLYGSWYPVDRW